MVLESFYSFTGIRVGAKIKSEIPSPEPKLVDIEEVWKEIQPIKNQKKFGEVKHGVFLTNIKLGAEFLGASIS
jgi:hypothetical protein